MVDSFGVAGRSRSRERRRRSRSRSRSPGHSRRKGRGSPEPENTSGPSGRHEGNGKLNTILFLLWHHCKCNCTQLLKKYQSLSVASDCMKISTACIYYNVWSQDILRRWPFWNPIKFQKIYIALIATTVCKTSLDHEYFDVLSKQLFWMKTYDFDFKTMCINLNYEALKLNCQFMSAAYLWENHNNVILCCFCHVNLHKKQHLY